MDSHLAVDSFRLQTPSDHLIRPPECLRHCPSCLANIAVPIGSSVSGSVDFAPVEIPLRTELDRRLCLPLLAKYAKGQAMKTVSRTNLRPQASMRHLRFVEADRARTKLRDQERRAQHGKILEKQDLLYENSIGIAQPPKCMHPQGDGNKKCD